jgi:hypothetical protein
MAARIAVATKRAKSELRLRQAVNDASSRLGIRFDAPKVPQKRFPDLYAAELIDSVAAFIEQVGKAKQLQGVSQ